MNLTLKVPGPSVIDAFAEGLKNHPDVCDAFSPQRDRHLPVYMLTLKDLVAAKDGQGVDAAAREVAWQCLAVADNDPENRALVGDVTPLHRAPRPPGQTFDGPISMTSLSFGPMINVAFQRAFQWAKDAYDPAKQAQLPQGEYEPRMLRVSGLLVSALWLKSLAGGTDYVVPLHTKIKKFEMRPYSMPDFLRIAQPLAAERLALQICV